jgi:glycosyltransferase involved in cell wall biosynthesis
MIRLVIFMQNPRFGYSGGRYHALILAEAFSARGNPVTIISNVETEVFEDLSNLPGHNRINFVVSKTFLYDQYIEDVGIVVIIPSMAKEEILYSQAAACTVKHDARLVLLNFESPNWFNSLSPFPRDESLWECWHKYGKASSVILCSANESVTYAKDYYDYDDKYTLVRSCPPAVNNFAAPNGSSFESSNRILVFARFTWAEQKGCADLRKFIRKEFEGFTLVVITGSGGFPDDKRQEIESAAAEVGMMIDLHESLSERAKVEQIKQASLVIFPSFFEGFGYPPVEALFYGTPCVAFDLPVLREFTDKHTYWVPVGDWEQFTETMVQALEDGIRGGKLSQYFRNRRSTLNAFGKRLEKIFREAQKLAKNKHLISKKN